MKAGIFFFSLSLLFNPGGSPPSLTPPPIFPPFGSVASVGRRGGASFFLCLLRIPPLFFSSSFLTTSIKPLPSLPPPPPPYPFYRLPGNPSQRKDPPSLPPSPSLLFILPSCCFSGGKEKEGRKERHCPINLHWSPPPPSGAPFCLPFGSSSLCAPGHYRGARTVRVCVQTLNGPTLLHPMQSAAPA